MFISIAASKHKTFLRNGLKDVQSRLKKGETGYVIVVVLVKRKNKLKIVTLF